MTQLHYTAFEGPQILASGVLTDVASKAKVVLDRKGDQPVLIFDDGDGRLIDIDYRGTVADVKHRILQTAHRDVSTESAETPIESASRGPGRPRLGVVSREVTLLPRHWEWLSSQPGGASVTIRKLVEVAKRANEGKDAVRLSQENAYRFMSSLAGDLVGFEEATRALFANNSKRFEEHTASWPPDIACYAKKLAAPAFGTSLSSGKRKPSQSRKPA